MFRTHEAQKIISLIYLLFSIVASFGQTPSITSDQTAITAITAISKARAEAFNKKDAEGIAKYFTTDAVLMAPEKPALRGQKAITDYYQSIFDEFDVALHSYYEEVQVSGDMAIGRGEATVILTPHGEKKSTTSYSKYLNVLRKQPDGSWKTTHDIWNGNGVSP